MINFAFLKDIDNYESRKVGRDKVNGLGVSTAFTSDEGYETALCDADGAHPVERYQSKKDAIAGHAKWLEKAKNIERVVKLGGLSGIVEDEEITLERVIED